MNKLPITIAAATALLCGTAAWAKPKPAATPTVAVKTTTKTTVAKPAPAAAKTTVTTTKTTPPTATVKATTVARSTRTTTTTTGGRMVQAKLANGKTVTYNCSLAGNKTKKACQ